MREAGSALSRNGIWASELFQGPQGSSLSLMEPPSHLGVSDVAPPECLTSTADGAHQGPTGRSPQRTSRTSLCRVSRAFLILLGPACSQNHQKLSALLPRVPSLGFPSWGAEGLGARESWASCWPWSLVPALWDRHPLRSV